MGNIWHDITKEFSSVGIAGKSVRKKRCLFIAGAAAAVLWCRLCDKKDPLVKGYPLMNKFIVPESFLSPHVLRIANRRLASMELPDPPRGIKRMTEWIDSGKGGKIQLTIYRPETMGNDMPCLVYFHGGGFCLKDAPYIHEHMEKYAAKAECTVVFVHYRTSEKHPFPTPFADCWAGLEYVREKSEDLQIAAELQDVKGTFHGFDVFTKTEVTKKMLDIRCKALCSAFYKQ